MDREQQKPLLENLVEVYPGLQQVSTVDLSGRNIARSDSGPLLDSSSDKWYQEIISGSPLSLETTVNKSSGNPKLKLRCRHQLLGKDLGRVDVLDRTVCPQPAGERSHDWRFRISICNWHGNSVVVTQYQNLPGKSRSLEKYPPVTTVRQGILGPFTIR